MTANRVLEDLWHDLRYAGRNLRRKPGFTVMVVATLALGIAANVAIFILVDTVLLRSLPVPKPDELVLFSDGGETGRALGGPPPALDDGQVVIFPYPLYERLRAEVRGMKLAAQDGQDMTSIVRGPAEGSDSGEQSAIGRCVSANFFEVLRVGAHRGRTFTHDAERPGAENPSLVLSHGYWQRRFGGDPQIVGAKLDVNTLRFTVVGIMPPGFTGATVGGTTDFWVPMGVADPFIRYGVPASDPEYSWLQLVGRLEPGTTLASAKANSNAVLSSFMSDLPQPSAATGAPEPLRIELLPGATGISRARSNFREPLLILMAGVLLLMLIVCLNVSHLMLARALSRQQEMSIRAALGATRMRVVRQLLAEGLVLALLGAGAGLLGARWLSDALASFASNISPMGLNLVVGTSPRVRLFALGLALGTALLLGLVPALHAVRGDLQQALRATAQATTSGGSRHRMSRLLLVSQVAFSLVLLVAAGLLSTTLGNLRSVQLGVDREHILVAHLGLQMAGVSDERVEFLYEDIPRRIEALPGVRSASLSEPGVLSGRGGARIEFPGTDLPAKGVSMTLVTRGYFDALGMRIVRGRGFQSSDSRDAPRVAIVNETMAASEFGGRDALGQRIRLEEGHDIEVVGVVSDARIRSIRRNTEPHFFLHAAQPHGTPARLGLDNLQVRAVGDPAQLAERARKAVAEAQTDLALLNIRTLDEQVDRTLVRERLLALLASAFGVGALFLVAVGLYGVISQWAAQRTREMGVRMALGATPGGVQWLVLRQALWLVLIGLVLGVPAAVAVARLLAGLLFEVTPLDPRALVGSTLVLVAVAALAAFLPARRASRLDPVSALRCD